MSLRTALWYQGILKSEFRHDVGLLFQAGGWHEPGTALSSILHEAFWDAKIAFAKPEFAPKSWLSPESGMEPTYDERSGLLRFWAEWDLHGPNRIALLNLQNYILPALTNTLISCHDWVEPVNGGEDVIKDASVDFRKRINVMNAMKADIDFLAFISQYYR